MSGRFGSDAEAEAKPDAKDTTSGKDDPSKPLPNAKHELFAQAVAKGASAPQTYKDLGYTSKAGSSDAAASRLLKHVKRRIEYIQAQVAAALVQSEIMDAQEVLREASYIGRTRMTDFFTVGKDGAPLLDFTDLTPAKAAAMQEITVEEFKDGRSDKREVRRVKFKLAPKMQAIELLAKHHGLLTEKHEHKHEHQHVLVTLLAELDNGSSGKVVEASADVPLVSHGKVIEHQG